MESYTNVAPSRRLYPLTRHHLGSVQLIPWFAQRVGSGIAAECLESVLPIYSSPPRFYLLHSHGPNSTLFGSTIDHPIPYQTNHRPRLVWQNISTFKYSLYHPSPEHPLGKYHLCNQRHDQIDRRTEDDSMG